MLLRRDKKKGDREKAELLLLKTLSCDHQGLCYDIQSWFSSISPTGEIFRNFSTCVTVHSGGLGSFLLPCVLKTLDLCVCIAGHSAITWKEDSSSSSHKKRINGSLFFLLQVLISPPEYESYMFSTYIWGIKHETQPIFGIFCQSSRGGSIWSPPCNMVFQKAHVE